MTPVPTHPPKMDTLLSPRAEEPPDGITKEDFAAFQQRTKALQDTAPSILFDPGQSGLIRALAWFSKRHMQNWEKRPNEEE